jgi:hypothetical protein
MKTIDWGEVELALSDVDFPASKQRLVAHAEQGGSSEGAVKALRALPLAIYESLAEVQRSVRI